MTTRAIVWTIVAILVVATIIFTIIARREPVPRGAAYPRDIEQWQTQYQRMLKTIERFQAQYEEVKITPPTAEESDIMSKIDATLQEWKTETERFPQLQTEEERRAWLKKVNELRREARKLLRDLRWGCGR